LEWWRSQVGLVQQEPFLFNDTIANNIEYGLLGSQWENADVETKRKLVEEACKEAFADEFISKLPWGYESQVGDAGVKLSGGQRRKSKYIFHSKCLFQLESFWTDFQARTTRHCSQYYQKTEDSHSR
jgi:ABC-type protease/lipase transport system fused ATPase/permease subunit